MTPEFRQGERVSEPRLICCECGGSAEGNISIDGKDCCDKCGNEQAAKVQCDKCGKPNDRAHESNYCTQCRAEYQKRLDKDREYRPYDAK